MGIPHCQKCWFHLLGHSLSHSLWARQFRSGLPWLSSGGMWSLLCSAGSSALASTLWPFPGEFMVGSAHFQIIFKTIPTLQFQVLSPACLNSLTLYLNSYLSQFCLLYEHPGGNSLIHLWPRKGKPELNQNPWSWSIHDDIHLQPI